MSPETPLTQFTTGLDGDDIFVMNRRGDTPDIGDVLYLAAEIDPLLAGLRAERDTRLIDCQLEHEKSAKLRDELARIKAERDTLQRAAEHFEQKFIASLGEADALRAALCAYRADHCFCVIEAEDTASDTRIVDGRCDVCVQADEVLAVRSAVSTPSDKKEK